MFVGRERELHKLENMYRSDKFECAIIYGRRRVGKTTLINEFCKGKKTIFHVGLESNAKANLESFSRAIFEYTMPDAAAYPFFRSFDEALLYVGSIVQDQRLVLVIDEYPYLAESERTFSSLLQKHIDHTFRHTRLFIILCGSSMSFMEYQVLGYQSPLYGRRTAQFKILPFTYYEASASFPGFTSEDKALSYGMTGGVPMYTDQIDPKMSMRDNLIERFFDSSAFLFEEPANLLKQECALNTLPCSSAWA